MDSRKFKKVNNDTPKLHHKKKKKQFHYKYIFKILLILIVIILVFSVVNSVLNYRSLPDNAELIYPSQFNFTPYGYEWNNQLYGCCEVNDTHSHYYYTLEQMATLAHHSHNTYNYSDGIYVNYTYDENNGVKVVDKIYDDDKKEILKPVNMDLYEFTQNARFISKDTPYISSDFGFTPEEYADSIF